MSDSYLSIERATSLKKKLFSKYDHEELERWLSGYEHLLLLQRTCVHFVAHTHGSSKLAVNSSSMGSNILFRPPQASRMHTGKTFIHIKLKKEILSSQLIWFLYKITVTNYIESGL